MIQLERHQAILAYLERKQTASVRELAQAVYASEASVRRDIRELERQGFAEHIYGGVILSKYRNAVVPLDRRDADNAARKEQVARQAAQLVQNGDTVLMDASSTVRRVIRYLGHLQNLKIITNNLRLFEEAADIPAQLYGTGGTFNRRNHNFTGPAAEAYVRTISADILFFSSQALSEDGDISDASEEETSLRRVMLSRAKRKYFLCDSSKLGERRLFTLCNRDELTGVICDRPDLIAK